MKALLTVTLLILSLFNSSKAYSADDYSIKDLVSALPTKIETIIGANHLSKALPAPRRDKFNLFTPLLPTLYYDDVYDLGPVGFLPSNSVSAFVQGFQFLRSEESEPIDFSYCAIYLIKSSKYSSLRRALTKAAQKECQSDPIDLWSFKDEHRSAYFSFVDKKILIFSTKKPLALEIASRIKENRKNGILNSWCEFHDLDLKSNYFAVRHYQKKLNVKYWSDSSVAYINDQDVIGFSFTSNSMEWNKAEFRYYSRKPSLIAAYFQAVMKSEDFPPGYTFQYKLLSTQNTRSFVELAANVDSARGHMFFIFPLLLGFVPT